MTQSVSAFKAKNGISQYQQHYTMRAHNVNNTVMLYLQYQITSAEL